MRTFFKTLVLALAVGLTISVGALAAAADWTAIPVQKVPTQVMTGYRRLFAHNRVLKAEKSGAPVLYRLTMQNKGKGKPNVVIFDAKGNPQR